MPVVTLNALETLLGAPGPIALGQVTVQYWAGSEPYVSVVDDKVTLSPLIVADIVDGVPVPALDLPATAGACCTRWDIVSFGGGRLGPVFKAIPASGPVDFGDLVEVDPETYAPVATSSVVQTVRAELLDGLRIERVTQAEYDAMTTPRPADVLFVITT